MYNIILIFFGICIGIIIGSLLTNHEWKNNAYEPKRLLKDGLFYKVILVDYLNSWDLAHIHFNFPEIQKKIKKD